MLYVVKILVTQQDILFNEEVIISTMYIRGRSVLHVLGKANRFQAVNFLEDDSSECVWKRFMPM